MSDITIRAENLSKRYMIAAARYRYDSLREQVASGVKSLFSKAGRPRPDENAFWALKDVSCEVRQGEIVGIIGRNGAGKSTLLKILSRITVPTSGRAEIFGRVGSLLEVGTGFHPELTGRENIYLSGAVIGMKKDEIRRHFDSIVDFSEVEKFLEVPVKRYSSGMYVRLAFAVAAHLEPEILLVDEVLSVGDAAFQKKCLAKIGDAAKGGRTVLFISHNMVAVNSLCGRVLWVDGGRIVEDGPPAQVVARYLARTGNGQGQSEEVWDDIHEAPGNDLVRIHRVRVRRQDDRQSDPLTMQTPFVVEVEYWNLIADAHLHITLHLYTSEGILAFTTGSLNDRSPMPAGLFRSVCHFPNDLLNSGSHRFVVLVVKDTSNVIYSHESGVSFDILDLRQRQGTYYGREPGVVQPVLRWSTEYLGEDEGIRTLCREHQEA
ncbi:MAG TPA: ABC transporter ATP-binding protein [Nitrospirota bacterium]|nr:ABC transporter ATP-binding protein [Nitrospirota bacterium]